MDIRIESYPALLGLHIKKPGIQVSKQDAELQHRHGSVEFTIDRKNGRVLIDNASPRQAIGIYELLPLSKKLAHKSKQTALEGIRRRVEEGFQMADIHKNGVVIDEIAARTAWQKPLQVEVKPKPPAKVEYKPGNQRIHWNIKPDQFNVSYFDTDVNLDWGRVQAYLIQKNYIEITWTGDVLDIVG